MLCDKCKSNPAKVHITKIINGKKITMNLCEKCAMLNENLVLDFSNTGFGLDNLITNLLDTMQDTSMKEDLSSLQKCENCGFTYEQFKKLGRLGCGECYNTFSDKLDKLIRRVQGSNVHVGKIPNILKGTLKVKNDIINLKKELKEKIIREEFEEAAIIRDEIKNLESQLDTDKGGNQDG